MFTHADVEAITGLVPKSARNLMVGLVNRGLATRLKPGLFILVPFELGREREYLGNPYVVARALAGTPEYFVSHASAMDLHQQPVPPLEPARPGRRSAHRRGRPRARLLPRVARNEPRDLYDLWYLTGEGLVDLATLIPEIES